MGKNQKQTRRLQLKNKNFLTHACAHARKEVFIFNDPSIKKCSLRMHVRACVKNKNF